jgi:hypothetical protein
MVHRTGALHPVEMARTVLKAILGRRMVPARAGTNAEPSSVASGGTDPTPKQRRGILQAAGRILDEWAVMPDRHVGWVLPAVAAALRRADGPRCAKTTLRGLMVATR